MPFPHVAKERWAAQYAGLRAADDDLPRLMDAGFRSVVSLVAGMRDRSALMQAAGFAYLWLPIPDGRPPSPGHLKRFQEFYARAPRACAVHCEGGLGRTGTLLAGMLILEGATCREALAQVREAQPAAIESDDQERFLRDLERRQRDIAP